MKDVAFVSGLSGDSARYRCLNQGEALALAGGSFDVRLRRSTDPSSLLDGYACFVLHRVPWDAEVERFVAAARTQGKRVLFDADDLVFDPALRAHVPLDELDEEGRRLVLRELEGSGRTLAAADAVTVATAPLAEHARRLGADAAVLPNLVGTDLVRLAEEALRRHPRRRGVTLAYLSGTPTHGRDFAEAADAVLWALETYREVRLRVVGPLPLDARFDAFGRRVERLPRQPWQELPRLLADVDVNLAPLERDNPFTEGKSCVKYLEAALVGVPTVASPRPDFRRAIANGRNGLLADGPDAWREALRRLVEEPELRGALGAEAREAVLRDHTTTARAAAVREKLFELGGVTVPA